MSELPRGDETNRQEKPPFEYWVGGSLPLNAESYVKRSADDQIFAGLMAGNYCYVLNSRQMGKSSLRVQTLARLQEERVICVSIDITEIGSTEVTAEQFYFGVLWAIVDQSQEQDEALRDWNFERLLSWWSDRNGLPFVQRWVEFMGSVLLKYVLQPIVIFIDEIDSTLALPFEVDDFFAAIRACYNRRVDDPSFKRLAFALLGVCAPQDLIQDKRRTPFNIGQAIELSGFSEEEAIVLAKGLPGGVEMLRSILAWTGGQPFLTQRVCRIVGEMRPPSPQVWGDRSGNGGERIAAWVGEVVEERVIRAWESNDEQVHFQTISDRMMADDGLAGAMLGVYQHILSDDEALSDGSEEQIALRLTGVVIKCASRLISANRVYKGIFDPKWVAEKLAGLRPYGEQFQKWVESGQAETSDYLLRGDVLWDAKIWADQKDRKLAPEDYRFLSLSQDAEQSFKFKEGRALNVPQLIQLCEKYPQEAQSYLNQEYFDAWLVGKIGEPILGTAAHKAREDHPNDSEKSLEVFIQFLYEYSGQNGFPHIRVTEKLAGLRPYGKQLQKWVDSGQLEISDYLLRGEALRKARNWADQKDRKLAPEDYRFLRLSQDSEQSFKFKKGRALDVLQLIQLCEKYPQEAQSYLIRGNFEQWLVGNIGEPSLGIAASSARRKYSNDSEKALEAFIRCLYEYLGQSGLPYVTINPSNLDMGKITVGCRKQIDITVSTASRGFVWGSITYECQTLGIRIDERYFDSRKTNKIVININLPDDINEFERRKYVFSGILKFDGFIESHHFQVSYEITPVEFKISPESLNLELARIHTGRTKRGSILVEIKKEKDLKISGYATSSNNSLMKIYPRSFDDSTVLDYLIHPSASTSDRQTIEIKVSVNGSETTLPVELLVQPDYIRQSLAYFPMALVSAVVFWFIRYALEQSTDLGSLYSLLAFATILGISIALSRLAECSRSTVQKPSVRTNSSGDILSNTLYELSFFWFIIIAIFFSWGLEKLGILSQFGYVLFLAIDFLSGFFYIFGIGSKSSQWFCTALFIVYIYAWNKVSVRRKS
jgi:hypothetical protein